PGNYRLTSPPGALTIGSPDRSPLPNHRVDLIGSGKVTTAITGNTSGFLISKGPNAGDIDNLGRMQGFSLFGVSGVGSGLIKLTGKNQVVADINTDGTIPVGGCGVDASAASSALICGWSGGGAGAQSSTNVPASSPGTVGFYLGNSCT